MIVVSKIFINFLFSWFFDFFFFLKESVRKVVYERRIEGKVGARV